MASAENAYLFRHAMMRLAAYELQPPLERSVLHAHACTIIEAIPNEDPDSFAYELAGHARDAALAMPDERSRSELGRREAAWVERAMQRARRDNNFSIALECAERLMSNDAADPAARHSGALLAAEMAASLAEFSRVPQFLACAEKLQAGAAPTLRAAWILSRVNAALLPRREYPECMELLNEALAIYRTADDRLGEARTRGYLGNVFARLEQREEAVEQYEYSEAIFRELGHKRGLSTCRGNLGLMYRYFGDDVKAESAYREAMDLDREIINREGLSRHLGNLAVLYRETERLDQAVELFQESDDLFRQLGDRGGWIRNGINHATCLEMAGQLHRAVALYHQAERLAEECGLAHEAADCSCYRGQALLTLKDTVRGEPALELAASRYELLKAAPDAARVWEMLGASSHAREEFTECFRYTGCALTNLQAANAAPGFFLLAMHAESALGLDRFTDAAETAVLAIAAAATVSGVDPIRLATLKAIAAKGQASSAT